MKILYVITSMQKAAGTTTFVENVVNELRHQGHDVQITMTASGFHQCDIIHIHGLWSGLLHNAVGFARRNNISIVWSTHGMTAPWSMRHKWWKKLPAWLLYQKWDLMRAAAIHCTTDQEVEWNKALGFKNCFIAPLGTREKTFNSPTLTHNTNHTLLFVGRIYPVKGLVNLVKAWGLCKPQSWKLRMVGPDQAGHKAELENLVTKLAIGESVEFVGPRYDRDLSLEYDNCDCLVLPSFTENFGATVVDALAHGKPCIASTYTPWGDLPRCGCGWWVSNEPGELALAINEMMAMTDEERRRIGERGRKLVEEKYTWEAVVNTMVAGYEAILNGRS